MTQNKTRKEKEQEEKLRKESLQTDYKTYSDRIEARKAKGEEIEAKPFEKWIRKAKKTIDGIETEIEVPGDTGETKKEKFKRLIDSRMVKVLNDMDLIINLSSPQYEPYDTEKIVNALRLKVLDIENSFKSQKKEEKKFSL